MRSAFSQAIAAATFLAAACVPAGAEEISAEDFGHLRPADVVVLGEVHDNPLHHHNQAAAVRALDVKALVFEMLTEAQALKVRPGMDAETLAEALEWEASGWPDFALYWPVFEAGEGLPVFGGALPRDQVRRAVEEGAAAVFGSGAPIFGLDAPLDREEQALREAQQGAAHCDALPVEMLPGMVEAQRLRDAALAQAVLAAMAETGGPVALITGNGHARHDWGVPRALAAADPSLRVLSIGQFETPPENLVPYDHWIVTAPAAREDPCAAFFAR
jgi:uncharacterized iron-regulated protein